MHSHLAKAAYDDSPATSSEWIKRIDSEKGANSSHAAPFKGKAVYSSLAEHTLCRWKVSGLTLGIFK